MPKPFKPTRPCRLPADADLVDVAGKPHVRLRERGKPVLYPLTKDGKNYLRPAKRWYFDLRDATGTVRRVKGFADLKATEQLAAELERKASRVRSGFTDPAEEHAVRPLVDHLKDYAAYLDGKGNVVAHNSATVAKIAALLSGCGFVTLANVDAGTASAWLAGLRRPGTAVDIPPGDAFASSEVAKLLGITVDGVRRFVARNRLPTVGQGPARKLPRSTVEALVLNRAKGTGPETVNHYVRAVRGFFAWLVKAKRLGSNPLVSLTLVNASRDVRRARRELAADELRRLFDAARFSARTYRGLMGADRYHLYLVAAGTGFRANALANLTPSDFDLDSRTPTATLAARLNKSRKVKVQPLPADVAEALRSYFVGKPSNVPVWGRTWAKDHRGAEMIRIDLDAAGIAYAVEGPDGPEYADFHALRHSFLTLGGRSGIDLRTLQELAGHSTPTLTARYSHRRLYDLAGAVDKLPNLVPTTMPNAVEIPLRLTGTNGDSGAVPGAVKGRISPHQSAPKYTFGIVGGMSEHSQQSSEKTGFGVDLHPTASKGKVRPVGFEPTTTRLKVSCSTN